MVLRGSRLLDRCQLVRRWSASARAPRLNRAHIRPGGSGFRPKSRRGTIPEGFARLPSKSDRMFLSRLVRAVVVCYEPTWLERVVNESRGTCRCGSETEYGTGTRRGRTHRVVRGLDRSRASWRPVGRRGG